MNTFDAILLITKPGDKLTQGVAKAVTFYAKSRKIRISEKMCFHPDTPLLIISVGGDGTMLGAMRKALEFSDAIVLGLNTGTLGFLSEEVPKLLSEYLDKIRGGKAGMMEKRTALTARISVNGETISHRAISGINEIVLTSTSINAAMTTEVFINDKFVNRQLGNGTLVSTATGSTAMSLSAGGVIVNPSTDTMQIVPILPHTLTARPIITAGNDIVDIRTTLTERVKEIEIHGDGRILRVLNADEGKDIQISVTKHPRTISVWRPKSWNFFNVLKEKMKW